MSPGDSISSHFRLLPPHRAALARLGIETIGDLLLHIPERYASSGGVRLIGTLTDGEHASVFGEVTKAKTQKTFAGRMPVGRLTIRDASGSIDATWFRQPYIAKMYPEGTNVRIDGTAKMRGKRWTMANPHIEKVAEIPGVTERTLFENAQTGEELDELYPVYPESKGITSAWFRQAVRRALAAKAHEALHDPIPAKTLETYHLPSLATAVVYAHRPKEMGHAESARKRFAFQEIFFIQLQRHRARLAYRNHRTFVVQDALSRATDFSRGFPFALTPAQADAVSSIARDLSTERPMLRLLEGDVGSGKTAVAAAIAAAVVSSRPKGQPLQAAYMCPTEILAKQQFESFIASFKGKGVQVGLLTGSGAWKFPSKVDPSGWTPVSRAQLLRWVSSGEVPILVGTHALIQKSVRWKALALAIIDEQHRFGTAQRGRLVGKGGMVPHLLSMTATPIPRTLALTVYGDLDLSVIDTMPPGRKPIVTEVVYPQERQRIEERIRKAIQEGRQAYVICPRIDEPDPTKELAVLAKSVKEEAKRLKERVFPDSRIEILHSKMKPKEKDAIMDAFARGEIDVLVSTSVVEVGVNVPNATIIVIEGAERFGLAQLHQLRGRVLRGTHQAYCYLYADAKSERTMERMRAVVQAKNGFDLAERDLAMRGAGELGGGKQWGISDLGMEAIRNPKMVEAARKEAELLLAEDPDLSRHPTLSSAISTSVPTHLE